MAKLTALVFAADGSQVRVTYDKKDQLGMMQGAVGGWITGLGLGMPGNMDAYANDEGLLEGLPVNARISRYLGRTIVGNVVIPNLTPHKEKKLEAAGLI